MMRIGVLSDTHGYLDDKIRGYLSDCDEIWHAGDVGSEAVIDELNKIAPVKGVFGNIDNQKVRLMLPENNIFTAEGMKILIRHISGYPGRYNAKAKEIILKEKPDLVVAGHSHILKIIYDKKLQHLHINPGAAGISGFHKVRTLVRFSLENKKISGMEVIEMKR